MRYTTLQATVALFICLALAALFPTVEYISILRADSNIFIAYPATIWAGSVMIFVLGAAAYYLMIPMLLSFHAATTAIAGSAMVMTYTMVFFSADARCGVSQSVIAGCAACVCAASNACNAVRFPQ